MNVQNFLINEIDNERMNDVTLLTVNFKRKSYLCTIHECIEIFGNLLLKECKKRIGWDNKEMENSFYLKVV